MQNLLNVGGSGVLAHQRMLVTTGNNISNVNTKGYSVQRTDFKPQVDGGGVGRGLTKRVVNQFAQGAVWRNTADHSEKQSYVNSVSAIDSILSNDALSLNGKIDATFASIHAMTDAPTSSSTRALTLAQFHALTQRFKDLDKQYAHQQKEMNGDLRNKARDANKLLAGICDMNKQIASYQQSPEKSALDMLKDKRDESIRQLSELMKIHTIAQPNGEKLVFMANGHSLVTAQEHATIDMRHGDPDPTKVEMYLNLGQTEAKLQPVQIGGAMGGMLVYRQTVMDPSRNKLGQLALTMADSFNRQNHLGMDLDGNFGGDIFKLPTTTAMPYARNSGSGHISATVIAGKSSSLTPYDYQIRFTGGSSFQIQRFDGAQAIGPVVNGSVSKNFQIDGLTLDMSGGFAKGDQFLLRPAKDSASNITVVMSQPQKLALAAPIRVKNSLHNLSNASIKISSITNTDSASSAFADGGGLKSSAPQKIVVTSSGDYQIIDGNNKVLATVKGSDGGDNLLSRASLKAGFDISIRGEPKAGDVFTISANTDGYSDNYNGLRMTDMQQQALVRKSLSDGSGQNQMTFNAAYANVVSFVGGNAAEGKIELNASKALLTQAKDWYDSVSGVNMDEEASNLIRFQQAYAASAQVIGVAQKTFDTLLNSVR